ncbi:MAG: non-hydrolyzing UDP-N-acetylglucosamine 2-epimerase [Thermoguttaceae bacterium]
MLRILFVFGTRPEGIKMAPLVLEAMRRRATVESTVCVTGQHREMLAQVTDYFEIVPDIDLALMQPNQTLASLTSRCLEGIDRVITETQPDFVVAQGDTTTVLAASLAAFYRKVLFVHVEAGLRSGNVMSPWPEEMNRKVASIVTARHCAPTTRAAASLLKEGYQPDSVRVTGNTVIDALRFTVEKERKSPARWEEKYRFLEDRSKKLILITAHRRESFGEGFESLCSALRDLANQFCDHEFVYPVHLNPNVRKPVYSILGGLHNFHLTEPAIYPEFVWLMDRSTIILSDSGGVQEEAPSLGKPVLVLRETTERPEAVDVGATRLVGTDRKLIVETAGRLLTDSAFYNTFLCKSNPYGNGDSATQILDWLESSPPTNAT